MTIPHLVLLLVSLALAGCGDDDPAGGREQRELRVAFAGSVGAEALELGATSYPARSAIEGFRPTRVSFYLSDVRVLGEARDGARAERPAADVAYVELDHAGEAVLDLAGVPPGEYAGLSFRVGLTGDQDATSPADHSPDHPLGRASEYWVDWGSYIFLKLEGRSDTLADGRARFDAAYTYHVGRSAELAREVTVEAPFAVGEGEAPLELDVDLATLLGLGEADELPLVGVADHRNGAAARIMDNVTRAFTPRR